MALPVTGEIADHIKNGVPSGFITKFGSLQLNSTVTIRTGVTCDVSAVGVALYSPRVISSEMDLPSGEVYDPLATPGRLYDTLGYMTFTQDVRLSGSTEAVAVMESYIVGHVGMTAALWFSGGSTHSSLKDIYGAKWCMAKMLPVGGWTDRELVLSSSNTTGLTMTLNWRQRSRRFVVAD